MELSNTVTVTLQGSDYRCRGLSIVIEDAWVQVDNGHLIVRGKEGDYHAFAPGHWLRCRAKKKGTPVEIPSRPEGASITLDAP